MRSTSANCAAMRTRMSGWASSAINSGVGLPVIPAASSDRACATAGSLADSELITR